MAYTRKTWNEKMNNGQAGKVVVTNSKMADVPAGVSMYIATPAVVDEYIRGIPAGTEGSLQQMRKDLAAQHQAQYCCPITSGIFLRIVAEAAYESMAAGADTEKITPFWRVIGPRTPLLGRLSFGKEFVMQQRKKEGLPF